MVSMPRFLLFFPALGVGDMYLLRILIRSLRCLRLLRLAAFLELTNALTLALVQTRLNLQRIMVYLPKVFNGRSRPLMILEDSWSST